MKASKRQHNSNLRLVTRFGRQPVCVLPPGDNQLLVALLEAEHVLTGAALGGVSRLESVVLGTINLALTAMSALRSGHASREQVDLLNQVAAAHPDWASREKKRQWLVDYVRRLAGEDPALATEHCILVCIETEAGFRLLLNHRRAVEGLFRARRLNAPKMVVELSRLAGWPLGEFSEKALRKAIRDASGAEQRKKSARTKKPAPDDPRWQQQLQSRVFETVAKGNYRSRTAIAKATKGAKGALLAAINALIADGHLTKSPKGFFRRARANRFRSHLAAE